MSGKSLADRTDNIKARMAGAQSAVHVRQLGKCDVKCHNLFVAMAEARANIGISVRDRDCVLLPVMLCMLCRVICRCRRECVLLLGSAVHAVQCDLP